VWVELAAELTFELRKRTRAEPEAEAAPPPRPRAATRRPGCSDGSSADRHGAARAPASERGRPSSGASLQVNPEEEESSRAAGLPSEGIATGRHVASAGRSSDAALGRASSRRSETVIATLHNTPGLCERKMKTSRSPTREHWKGGKYTTRRRKIPTVSTEAPESLHGPRASAFTRQEAASHARSENGCAAQTQTIRARWCHYLLEHRLDQAGDRRALISIPRTGQPHFGPNQVEWLLDRQALAPHCRGWLLHLSTPIPSSWLTSRHRLIRR